MTVFCSGAIAQTSKIDSLKRVVSKTDGKVKVDALNKLSFYLLTYSNKEFAKTVNASLTLSEALRYDKGRAEALILSGINEFTIGHKEKSTAFIKEGIRISTAAGEPGLRGYGLTQLGINFQYQDQIDSAMRYYRLSFIALQDSLHPYYLSRVYLGMAECYGMRREYANQLKYLNKCLRIRELIKDESVVWLFVRIAAYHTDRHDYAQAIHFLDKAQQLSGSDTINNEKISEIHAQRAIVSFKLGNYQKALKLFYEARKYYDQNLRKQELTNLLLNIGLIFDTMDNYDLSIRNYFEALSLAETNHYTYEQIKLEYEIGWSYFRLGQSSLAEKYVLRSLHSAEKYNHPSDVANAYNLLGMIAGSGNDLSQALLNLNKALDIRRQMHDPLRIATTLFNIGTIYEKKEELDSSLLYQNQSLKIREDNEDEEAMADSYQLLGRLYSKKRSYNKATEYLEKAETLARKNKVSYILLNVLETRRDLLKNERKFEMALKYSHMFQILKDSIFTNNLSSRLSILENVYRLQEKEREIQVLSQQQKLQQENLVIKESQISQQRTIIMFTIGILLLVSIVTITIFRFYRKVKSLNQEVTEQNEEIQSQSEELSESNTTLAERNDEINEQKQEILKQAEELAMQNETISQINLGLEENILIRTNELKQAYKELDTFFYRSSHDFRRPLTTFMGLAEVAKITIKDDTALELFEKVNETALSLDKMLFKLRSISDVGTQHLTIKEVFIKDIFEEELKAFNSEIIRNNIQVYLTVNIKKPFFSYQALLQIIIQNLLENSIIFCARHNPVIRLNAYEKGNDVIIEVDDNGEGIRPEYTDKVFEMYFRASERSKGNGLGLYIVKKTVQKLNGTVTMISLPEEGTMVKITLNRNISYEI